MQEQTVANLHLCSCRLSQQFVPGRTPLHCAARRGQKPCVEALLAAGADKARSAFGLAGPVPASPAALLVKVMEACKRRFPKTRGSF